MHFDIEGMEYHHKYRANNMNFNMFNRQLNVLSANDNTLVVLGPYLVICG